jgi:hypothetical protein
VCSVIRGRRLRLILLKVFLTKVPHLLEGMKLELCGTLVAWSPLFTAADTESACLAEVAHGRESIIHRHAMATVFPVISRTLFLLRKCALPWNRGR